MSDILGCNPFFDSHQAWGAIGLRILNFKFYFRNIADATREIISRVPRETYQPSSEVPQSVSHHSRAPEIQSYLGNSQLHLNAFNVQVSQQKEEISVDDSFDDRVS